MGILLAYLALWPHRLGSALPLRSHIVALALFLFWSLREISSYLALWPHRLGSALSLRIQIIARAFLLSLRNCFRSFLRCGLWRGFGVLLDVALLQLFEFSSMSFYLSQNEIIALPPLLPCSDSRKYFSSSPLRFFSDAPCEYFKYPPCLRRMRFSLPTVSYLGNPTENYPLFLRQNWKSTSYDQNASLLATYRFSFCGLEDM